MCLQIIVMSNTLISSYKFKKSTHENMTISMVKGLQFSLLSIKQLSEKIRTNDISPLELVEFCFNRIRKFNPLLKAFITIIDEEDAYNNARIAEREISQGNYRGPLHGIPFSIKDIIYVKDVRCTAGSKILSEYIPKVDATCIKKIKQAGAILLGTNNLNEFASGITGLNPFYGNTRSEERRVGKECRYRR